MKRKQLFKTPLSNTKNCLVGSDSDVQFSLISTSFWCGCFHQAFTPQQIIFYKTEINSYEREFNTIFFYQIFIDTGVIF